MRCLAILILCAGVSAGLVSRAAAAPVEEELVAEPPAKEITTGSVRARKPVHHRKARKAMAAMPMKAVPRTVTGRAAPSFYAGVHIGGAWTHFTAPAGGQSVDGSGVIGGGQVGVNYQIENLVFGVEGDISASGVRGDVSGDLGGTAVSGSVRNDWFATLAGRFGVSSGRTLTYVKAGAAWTRYKWEFTAPGVGTAAATENRTGWMLGAGIEYAIAGALSAKIEYNYLNFGERTETLTTTGGLVALPTSVDLDVHVVKLGLNHRFAY
jgi:outer membrane immunogenic protein